MNVKLRYECLEIANILNKATYQEKCNLVAKLLTNVKKAEYYYFKE